MNILQDIANRYAVSLANTDYELKKQITLKMRSRLHANALISAQPDKEIRIDFLYMFEGLRLDAYYEKTSFPVSSSYCANSCVAVGCGFNMSRPEARIEWSAVLPDSLFDEVFAGKKNLTLEQVSALLDYSLDKRVEEMKILLGEECWHELPECIQIALESVYYNIPSLFTFKRNKSLCNFIREFVRRGEMASLYQVSKLMLEYQHKVFHHVLHKRRRIESLLLCGVDDACEIQNLLDREEGMMALINEGYQEGGSVCMLL